MSEFFFKSSEQSVFWHYQQMIDTQRKLYNFAKLNVNNPNYSKIIDLIDELHRTSQDFHHALNIFIEENKNKSGGIENGK